MSLWKLAMIFIEDLLVIGNKRNKQLKWFIEPISSRILKNESSSNRIEFSYTHIGITLVKSEKSDTSFGFNLIIKRLGVKETVLVRDEQYNLITYSDILFLDELVIRIYYRAFFSKAYQIYIKNLKRYSLKTTNIIEVITNNVFVATNNQEKFILKKLGNPLSLKSDLQPIRELIPLLEIIKSPFLIEVLGYIHENGVLFILLE